MKRSVLPFACALVLFAATHAFGQAGAPASTAAATTASASAFDFQAKFLNDMKDVQKKFDGLAEAIPQDKYTWRPGEGVRSVSEVFLHVALGNYFLTHAMGPAMPAGITPNPSFEKSTTDKAAIIDSLNKSFAYMISSVQAMSPADLAKPAAGWRGGALTGNEVLLTIVADLHEHLGQQIAYARSNNVVPPWTAERQASQAARGATPPATGGR